MSLTIFQIIILLGIIQGVHLAAFLILWKSIRSRANIFLAGMLISLSGNLLQYWLRDVGIFTSNELELYFFPWHTLIAPLFLLYINELKIFPGRRLPPWLLFIPFIAVCLVQVGVKSAILATGLESWTAPSFIGVFYRVEEYFTAFYSLVLILYVFRSLRHERRRSDLKSFGVNRDIVRWIKGLSWLAAALCGVWFTSLFFFDVSSPSFKTYYPLWIILVLIITFLGTIGSYYSFKYRDWISQRIDLHWLDLAGVGRPLKVEAPGELFQPNQLRPLVEFSNSLAEVNRSEQLLRILNAWLAGHLDLSKVTIERCNKGAECHHELTIREEGRLLIAPLRLKQEEQVITLHAAESGFFNEVHLYLIKMIEQIVQTHAQRLEQADSIDQLKAGPYYRQLMKLLGDRIYTDGNLDLSKLAAQLGMSPGYLSKLINGICDCGFNDFINSYRVAYVKELMRDPDFSGYTLTGIGLEAGFNSKSTFYSAFRKLEGMSPGEYRRRQSEVDRPQQLQRMGSLSPLAN